MKKSVSIVATVHRPLLLQSLVEKLAHRRQNKHEQGSFDKHWSFAGTSTVETYTEGSLIVKSDSGSCNLSFATPFVFTCIEKQTYGCALAWSQSLS